uniref:Helicase ATP-binding domain-containing protein n=1 Tax=viral metagenome TaxID=1070528 RepID=A0A6C0F9I8_9ZZZZ|tara:strand:- start:6664 stop:9237 length:2574 start_codon:yes stop_codon:yes gene_type:complete
MVNQITDEAYTNNDYQEYYDQFPFSLSPFQKFAIEAIVTGNHSLSCVPTGSGKTLPALFAIDFFTSQTPRKKVIYTSPIKALSNQKYYEFTQKFPHLSIGLLTGDIKINPEADVLIMTAEILQNTLYKQYKPSESKETNVSPLLMFDIDFKTELACVIQDEVHMINDADRGHVWENTILMLPPHIQMVMLSATLDNPAKFAQWIEDRHSVNESEDKKSVYLATSTYRPVPLTHYSFITAPSALFKSIKDKSERERIHKQINTMHVLQTSTGKFQETKYYDLKKTLDLISQNKVFVKRTFVLNEVCKHMVEHEMLPAVCFILSKKQIQVASKEVTVPLLEDDSKVPYTVARECEQLLRSKIPNYQEYLELPEYIEMIQLLEKGIAIHHSGVMPILREIVELMFEKGYIKLLFATETFSVGLNMPIKSVLFTDVKKFDGSGMRMLHSHEFVQASGRAGRRGIDTVGNVIHLPNLFRNIDLVEYRTMMQGKPQSLVSKFRVSYNLVFNLIASESATVTEIKEKSDSRSSGCVSFCQSSMLHQEIQDEMLQTKHDLEKAQTEANNSNESLKLLRTPLDVIEKYTDMCENVNRAKNKERKRMEREITMIENQYRNIKDEIKRYHVNKDKNDTVEKLKNAYTDSEYHMHWLINIIIEHFIEKGYVASCLNTDNQAIYELTVKATYAANIRETPCMVFAEIINTEEFTRLDSIELACLFSCFAGIRVGDEKRVGFPQSSSDASENLRNVLAIARDSINDYLDFENYHRISTGTEYEISYDIIHHVAEWCKSTNVGECRYVLETLEQDTDIGVGEFVKVLIKINNIASEIERAAEFIGNMTLVGHMKEIPTMTLKYVATNQSLYV